MRRLLIALAALSLFACATIPSERDLQKEIVRAEVQIDGLMALNYKFYMSEFIDKEQYNENLRGLSGAKSNLETIKNLLTVGRIESADDRLEKILEALHALDPS